MYNVLFNLLLVLLLSAFVRGQTTRVLCYYANWSEERNEQYRLLPRDIDPWLCTHIVYAFAMPDLALGIVPMDFLESFTEGGSSEFSRLQKLNPNLKLLLSVGGWNEGSIRFSKIASDPGKREWFAEYACQFVRGVGFDGLDINWQWPGLREGSNTADKENFALLVKATRRFFELESIKTNRSRLLVSVVVPPLYAVLNNGFNIYDIEREVDFLNILTMEYHTPTDPVVNHPAPLFPIPKDQANFDDRYLNAASSVDLYLNYGLSPAKLNMGIPFFGHSYLLENPVSNSLGSLAEDEGTQGFGTGLPGTLAYYEICKYVKDEGWFVEHPNRTAMGPYAYRDKDWVAFDDVDIVKRKVRYAKEKRLGGVMLWTIDLDDFNALCNESFPLTRAAREAISEDKSGATTKSPAIALNAQGPVYPVELPKIPETTSSTPELSAQFPVYPVELPKTSKTSTTSGTIPVVSSTVASDQGGLLIRDPSLGTSQPPFNPTPLPSVQKTQNTFQTNNRVPSPFFNSSSLQFYKSNGSFIYKQTRVFFNRNHIYKP